MYQILYFSPTGNTKVLAERLQDRLHVDEVFPIEHNFDLTFSEKNIILMYPIHGFNPPRTIIRYVKQLPPGTNNIFLVAVGCAKSYVNDAVHSKVKKILKKKNYNVLRDDVFAMPLTMIMDFKEDLKREQIKTAFTDMDQLAEDIINQLPAIDKFVCFKSKLFNTIGKVESPAARLFGLELHANKKCTKCGLCVSECPEKNITMKKKPSFGFKCSMCMRCIYQCPERAISPWLSTFMTIKNGYDIKAFIKKEDSLL